MKKANDKTAKPVKAAVAKTAHGKRETWQIF
jgi:hypothetical protein